VIFRSVSPRYARATDIVSGYGSYREGGRWNAPGVCAIYGSIEPGLALMSPSIIKQERSFGFNPRSGGLERRP
jgi:RES domain-containing protein